MDDLRQDLAAISQQQHVILAAIQAIQPPGGNMEVLRADVSAVTAKLEKDLEEQKKSYPTYKNSLPPLRLELIGWKRELTGIRRFYRAIGQ